MDIEIMTIYEYGNIAASVVLIQPVGEHDLPEIEDEIAEIKKYTDIEFRFIAVKVDNWNNDLTPWKAPPAFGNTGFGDGAEKKLEEITKICNDKEKTYYLGGYSLSALFALWAACQINIFTGIAAASPSVWYPDFAEYMRESKIKSKVIYLSLGDKEEKTRNSTMTKVGDCIRQIYDLMKTENTNSTLEWNEGGHFKETNIRTAKAFAWVLNSAVR